MLSQNPGYNMPGTGEFDGNLFDTNAGNEFFYNLRFRELSDKPVFNRNAIFNKPVFDDRICDMEAPGDLLNIPSGLIELDDIVNVEHSNYEGLVYTFETDNQMYDVSGIIARNCRCTVGFNVLKDAQGLPVRTV